MCGHGWPVVCGVPVSVHVMQIYWLLRTISEDQRGSNKAILSLLQSCEEAAMHVHLPVYGAQSQHALGSGAERLAQAATQPGGNAASTTAPPQARGQDRLSRLSMQLGNGEGVTQLVQASMDDLSSGGTGVLSRSPPSDRCLPRHRLRLLHFPRTRPAAAAHVGSAATSGGHQRTAHRRRPACTGAYKPPRRVCTWPAARADSRLRAACCAWCINSAKSPTVRTDSLTRSAVARRSCGRWAGAITVSRALCRTVLSS
jgi:hypothetical protein